MSHIFLVSAYFAIGFFFSGFTFGAIWAQKSECSKWEHLNLITCVVFWPLALAMFIIMLKNWGRP